MEKTKKFNSTMIVDDNLMQLLVIDKLIKKCSFSEKSLKFSKPEEALEYLKIHQENPLKLPEVILLDIYMPVMNGFEFMKAYSTLSPTVKNQCHVVIVSSSISEEDIRRAAEHPFVKGFYRKPLTEAFFESIPSDEKSASS